jgi:hypothetical protein
MVVSALVALFGFSAIMAGTASASTHAVITFGETSVTLTIPTPACPTTEPTCQWKFFLNEPKTHVDVATVYGTSGTLTLDYPADFCGIIQADAYIGGPPWVPQRGFQYKIPSSQCVTPLTPPPSGGSTVQPPSQLPGTLPTGSGADTPAPATTPAPVTTPDALPFTSTTPTTVAVAPVPTTTKSTPADLPFTGLNAWSLLLVGLGLLALSLLLLSETAMWRRLGRMLVIFVNGPV